jgi:hypothetical protein
MADAWDELERSEACTRGGRLRPSMRISSPGKGKYELSDSAGGQFMNRLLLKLMLTVIVISLLYSSADSRNGWFFIQSSEVG